jgi:exodeoxyribonuclease-3
MRLASWNVNSIRQRAGHVHRWLARAQPDLLFLQEIKTEAAGFPADTFADLGYTAEVVGQKAYNGVAVLGRVPFTCRARALPGLPPDDPQARYVEVEAGGLIAGGLYLPNGNSGGEAGYAYKLAWMDALAAHAEQLLAADTSLALLGDFNVCPTEADLAPGSLPPDDALVRPASRSRFRRLIHAGMTDALRALHPDVRLFTFWDYQAGAWQRDRGLRIDHALLSPDLAERLVLAEADRAERDQPQPSDHVPIMVELG